MDGGSIALRIFEALVQGGEAERHAAVTALGDPALDRDALRLLIRRAVTGSYAPGQEREEGDQDILWARSWLLNTLAKIADDDAESKQLVREHLNVEHEPSFWVRYWVLEGLIAAKASDLTELARHAAADPKEDDLVRMLGKTILASRGDREALADIKKAIEDPSLRLQWATLRALRIVPLTATMAGICGIVEQGSYSDETYDAIVALGRIPRDSAQAERAARTLTTFVATHKRSPLREGMRVRAMEGLANLRAEGAAPVLIESLSEESPALVRQAALALKESLGTRTAAARVVEAASRLGPDRLEGFAMALRWMGRDVMAEELESLMTSGPAEQQEIARRLLSEIGGAAAFQKLQARKTAIHQYVSELEKAEEKIRVLFEKSIEEAQRGFKGAVVMDFIVFFLGVMLVLASAISALAQGNFASWAGVGGTGVLGILYATLIGKPRQKIQEAVDHLMQLKIIFLGYLRQLHQADQAYTRRLLESDTLSIADVSQFSQVVERTMDRANHHLASIGRSAPGERRAARGRHPSPEDEQDAAPGLPPPAPAVT
jgi:HEAT repeat protein